MKRTFAVFALLTMVMFAGFAQAQTTTPATTTPAPSAAVAALTEGFNFTLQPGLTTLWLGERNHGGGFIAEGLSVKIAEYDKNLSSGSTLAVTFKLLGATKVTGQQVGNSVTALNAQIDIVKLFTGIKGLQLFGSWSLSGGPALAYDPINKCAAGGVGFDVNF